MSATQNHKPTDKAVQFATYCYKQHEAQRYRVELAEGGNVYEVVDGEADHPNKKIICRTTFEMAERIANALNRENH